MELNDKETANKKLEEEELSELKIKLNDKEEAMKKLKGDEETKINLKEVMENIVGEDGFKRYFNKIKKILKEFMDMEEEHYSLVSLWIIGTYLHKQFPSFPYLFFNAMKGSGKTRVLKIISNLAKNGKLAGSMTEAVLFRKASERTLCIDELEGMNAKGNENLKLLLNSGYKKGLTIERMTKRTTKEGEKLDVEEFEVYCPIVMANIWGMTNTLGDRCIITILEKSSKVQITKLIENFEYNDDFKIVRGGLLNLTDKIKDNDNIFGTIFNDWNEYVQKKNDVNEVSNVKEVSNVNNVSNKENTDNIDNNYIFYHLFKKIDETNVSGRDLELFIPLFLIADMCSPEILDEIIGLSKTIIKDKKETDVLENKDVRIYEFIAQSNYEGYVNTSDIAEEFSDFYGEEPKYNTSRSIGMALKRLKLVLDSRSTGKKRQVKVNVLKAKEKLLMFKEPEQIKATLEDVEKAIEELNIIPERVGENNEV